MCDYNPFTDDCREVRISVKSMLDVFEWLQWRIFLPRIPRWEVMGILNYVRCKEMIPYSITGHEIGNEKYIIYLCGFEAIPAFLFALLLISDERQLFVRTYPTCELYGWIHVRSLGSR